MGPSGSPVQRLALNKEQIQALPDNYQAATNSKKFPTSHNLQQRETSFLPSDLFQPDGPWVCIGPGGSAKIEEGRGPFDPEAQDFYEFKLSRIQLFAGKEGGLRSIERDEKDFVTTHLLTDKILWHSRPRLCPRANHSRGRLCHK